MFLTKKYIEAWLHTIAVKNYTINDDLTVDVFGYVDISNENLTEIPVQFGKISGYFDCSHNKLTSLKNCPKEVNGSFYFYDNILEDINDLDSKIFIKNEGWKIFTKKDLYDKYFEHWIEKDPDILYYLKNKISKKCLRNIKYKKFL